VVGLVCQAMRLGEPDASGRRSPVAIPGELETFACDTVIYALGTRANPIIAESTPGLATNKWGYLTADPVTQATNLPGVFAGGDIVTGGATVILAMGAGRRAAAAIERWLSTRAWPPVESDTQSATSAVAASRPCPKCHQPLSDDSADYICCAGSTLTWHCTACAKVYEGFAYPYGLCPACGGALARDHSPEVGSAPSLEAVRRAFEIELGGMAYYGGGARRASDPDVRELFARLAEMERGHLTTLERRYHVKAPEVGGELTPTQVAIYAEAEPPTQDAHALLRLAVTLERRARDFFAAEGARLTPGSTEQRLYKELQAEEQEHLDLLSTELRRLIEGRPGLL
jgi:glutamate synthase (NADPH/NADH) small chain